MNNFFSSAKRSLYALVRVNRNHGFGVQSPFAYQFITEVARGRQGTFRSRLDEFLKVHDEVKDVKVIEGIHSSRHSYKSWLRLASADDVSVSFDLYDIGVLFYGLNLTKRNYKATIRGAL